MTNKNQPYYDLELAKISAWLKANGYTMHVKISGEVTLVKKPQSSERKRSDAHHNFSDFSA